MSIHKNLVDYIESKYPCPRYQEYRECGAITDDMNLYDVITSKQITWDDKDWLLCYILEDMVRRHTQDFWTYVTIERKVVFECWLETRTETKARRNTVNTCIKTSTPVLEFIEQLEQIAEQAEFEHEIF